MDLRNFTTWEDKETLSNNVETSGNKTKVLTFLTIFSLFTALQSCSDLTKASLKKDRCDRKVEYWENKSKKADANLAKWKAKQEEAIKDTRNKMPNN